MKITYVFECFVHVHVTNYDVSDSFRTLTAILCKPRKWLGCGNEI